VADLLDAQQQALDPLRTALLGAARAEAEQLRRSAAQEGEALVGRAQEQAARVLDAAGAEGEAEGRELAARAALLAEQRARAVVLQAQHAAYRQLVVAAGRAVARALREPDRRTALTCALRRRLGGEAEVGDTADGGLWAQAPDGRTVDASVGTLVARAMEGLDLEQLWSPG
jgi:hypothetical protein